jgi:hypothetical protein
MVAAVLLVQGCASMANPFVRQKPRYNEVPVESLQAAAQAIEAAVARGDREAAIPPQEGLALDDPAVAQIIRKRAARSELVSMVLDTGHAHEQRGGLIALKPSRAYREETTRRERDRHALIILEENNDRWLLYEGLVKASNLPSRSLSAVQEAFHEARVANLAAGQRYENADGEITVK